MSHNTVQFKQQIYIFYSWIRQRPITYQQKFSQSRGDNRSYSHVFLFHFVTQVTETTRLP